MHSMTGCGSGKVQQDGWEVTIDLKTVNHRFLDIGMRLPRNLNFLEQTIRDGIGKRILRGHVDVFLTVKRTDSSATTVECDPELAGHYLEAAALLAEAAKSGHLIIVKGRISAEIDEIRMGKIEKSARIQCLFALAAVKPQIIFSVPRFPVIAVSFIFVVDVVLTQKKVLNGIGFYQTEQPLP